LGEFKQTTQKSHRVLYRISVPLQLRPRYREHGFAAMLSKPFAVKELSAEIDRVLAG
jgi:hypothetical protein